MRLLPLVLLIAAPAAARRHDAAVRDVGYDAVDDVRQGKLFELEIASSDEKQAKGIARELCEKLLANPVIEDYTIVRVER